MTETILAGFLITIFDSRHCVPMQKHFDSKDELLGFVVGFNQSQSGQKYL